MSKLIAIIVLILIISGGVFISKTILLSDDDIDHAAYDFISEYIKEEESKLGASCGQIEIDVERFFYNSIEPMIVEGKKGGNWWSMVNQSMMDDLIKYEEYLTQCWAIYDGANKYGKFNAEINYKELFEIVSGIKTIIVYTNYDVINKEKFNKKYIYLEKYYIRWKAWIRKNRN